MSSGKIFIDGIPLNIKGEETILRAMMDNNIDIPHVCYNPALGAIESCDTCIVNVDGKYVRACTTQAKNNMIVQILC